MMKKSNKKGFTLVELIVVIAIMAILAAVLVPTVTSKIKEANKGAAKSEIGSIISAARSVLISQSADGKTTMTYEDFITALKAECGTDLTKKIEDNSKGYKIEVTPDATNNKTKITVSSLSYTDVSEEVTIDGFVVSAQAAQG